MPDQDTSGFSRVCPSCGRRVPRAVATCRCGVTLPPEEAGAALAPEAPESGGSSTVFIAIALVLALAGAGYWMFMKPAPAATAAAAVGEDAKPEAESVATGVRAASPEARAWDASANAKELTPAEPPPPISPVAAASRSGAPLPSAIEDMVDRVMPAVVLIETTTGRGSGFFVRHDTLITNVHVVQNDSYVTLRRMDGSSVNARVESRAPALDIAVLKVGTPSASQAVIPMGSAHGLKPGQEIVVIGSALGTLQNSVSRGIVSGLRTAGGATLVQTDAATNPGNSGGPMLDRNGSVIGITTMGYSGAQGLNFGVAIDHARDLLDGKQVNLGTQGGLKDIQSQTNASDSDRMQQQGEQQFLAAIKQLAQAADRFDDGWERFRQQCYTSPIPGNYERGWFVVLAGRLPNGAASGCSAYFNGMSTDMNRFRDLMKRALDEARRANVLPGTIRDTLRSNRLDFDW
jgi:S1-C subfamily serine protease